MKRLMVVVIGMLILAGLGGVTASRAEDAKPDSREMNLSTEKGKEGGVVAVRLFSQASDLIRYARENESATAMLVAVQMLRRVRLQEGSERLSLKQVEGMDNGEPATNSKKGNTPAPTFDTRQLLAEAKSWAKGNKHLLALLDAEAAKPIPASGGTLGVQGRPILHKDTVKARTNDDFILTFIGGEVARVVVFGDGDTNLDLYIFDENGNQIVKDTDGTDRCVVEWAPKWTGPFRVRIVNLGNIANQYALATN